MAKEGFERWFRWCHFFPGFQLCTIGNLTHFGSFPFYSHYVPSRFPWFSHVFPMIFPWNHAFSDHESHPFLQVMESWANAEWFTNRPEVPEKVRLRSQGTTGNHGELATGSSNAWGYAVGSSFFCLFCLCFVFVFVSFGEFKSGGTWLNWQDLFKSKVKTRRGWNKRGLSYIMPSFQNQQTCFPQILAI